MSDKKKHPEGAVSVNDKITPITRKPIDQIDASQWEDMSFEALSEEYTKLMNRINLTKSMGRTDLAKQMNNGLNYLLQLMETKKPKNEDAVTLL